MRRLLLVLLSPSALLVILTGPVVQVGVAQPQLPATLVGGLVAVPLLAHAPLHSQEVLSRSIGVAVAGPLLDGAGLLLGERTAGGFGLAFGVLAAVLAVVDWVCRMVR